MIQDNASISSYPTPKIIVFLDKVWSVAFLWLIPRFVTPNEVTWFRFFTIPFVIYFLIDGNYEAGGILFVISAFSDLVDGALARTRNMVTEWGKLYDPVADKLLVGSVVTIMVSRFIDIYLALAIILLEILIVAEALYRKKFEGYKPEARLPGKIKMVFQCFGISFLFLSLVAGLSVFILVSEIFLWGALFFALLSLIVYRSI